jgi:hypothetical protein
MALVGEVEGDPSGCELGMPQVTLAEPGMPTGCEAVGGIRMAAGRDGDPSFGNAGPRGGSTAGARDTGPTQRGGGGRPVVVLAPWGGKKPGPVPVGVPGGTAQRERIGGQRDVPVWGALATMEMDQEAPAIAGSALARAGCMPPEAHALAGGAVDLVVEGRRCGEEPPHLLHTEDGGETVGGGRAQKRVRVPGTLEDVVIAAADAAGADTQRRGGEAIDILSVQAGVLQCLCRKAVRGLVVELSQQVDFPDIGLWGTRCLATQWQGGNHWLPQWRQKTAPFGH